MNPQIRITRWNNWVAVTVLTLFHLTLTTLFSDRLHFVYLELPALALIVWLASKNRVSPSVTLCYATACMFNLCVPSVGWSLFIWFAFIPVIFFVQIESKFRALWGYGAWTGFLIASGFYGWLFGAMMVFFNFNWFSALFGYVIVMCVLMLPMAVIFPLARLIYIRSGLSLAVIFPVLYALSEFWSPGPMPMILAFGVAWQPLFLQTLDIIGVNGVAFLIAVINGALYLALKGTLESKRPLIVRGVAIAGGVFFVILIYGFWGLQHYANNESEPSLDVAIVQPCAPLKIKNNDTSMQNEVAARLKELSLKVIEEANKSPDLLLWPEGAGAFASRTPSFNPAYMEAVNDIQRATSTTLLVHNVEFKRMLDSGKLRYYSAATLIEPVGKPVGDYYKEILMPFSEYLPFENQLPFLRKLLPESRSILPGKNSSAVNAPGGPCAVLICFELLFQDYVRKVIGSKCTYIVNLTNDRWYGRLQQPPQHLCFAVVRAIENRKPVARATNSGISALVDARGVIEPQNQTPTMAETTLRGRIYPRSGRSFYNRFGDILHLWILTPLFIIALLYIYSPFCRTSHALSPSNNPSKKPAKRSKSKKNN